jgi:hypothetical protein
VPFIVTTTRLDLKLHGEFISRRAVATPEEARTTIEIGPDGRAREQEVFDEMESWEGDESITVGPLPDGTVIEVEPGRGQQRMRQDLREWGVSMDTRDALDDTIVSAWVAAYNAAQGS